jgi:hypothetical protein
LAKDSKGFEDIAEDECHEGGDAAGNDRKKEGREKEKTKVAPGKKRKE